MEFSRQFFLDAQNCQCIARRLDCSVFWKVGQLNTKTNQGPLACTNDSDKKLGGGGWRAAIDKPARRCPRVDASSSIPARRSSRHQRAGLLAWWLGGWVAGTDEPASTSRLGGWVAGTDEPESMSRPVDAGSSTSWLVADAGSSMIDKPAWTSRNRWARALTRAYKGRLLAIYGIKRHHIRSASASKRAAGVRTCARGLRATMARASVSGFYQGFDCRLPFYPPTGTVRPAGRNQSARKHRFSSCWTGI